MDLKDQVKNLVISYFKTDNRVLSVYLLGSVNSGTYRPDSDIDLAIMVKPGETISVLDKTEISNKLSFELERTVDIGEISSKNLIYSFEALFKGDIIYTSDMDSNNFKRTYLIGMYFQLNIDRKEILDAYRA